MRRRKTAIFAVLVLLVVPAVLVAAPPAILIVKEHQTGNVLFRKPVEIGEPFTLYYVHSITKQPVQEVYHVHDRHTLALEEMRFDSFGSNLPVGPERVEGKTTSFDARGGYYRVTYEGRFFERVPLRVGQVVADHRLLFRDGTCFRFLDATKGGTYVDFYVRPFLAWGE